ncbi:Protein sprouty 2 [Clarias magur]|uniref:Protein sprouty 2 n=1 Tax=Clarias magur TaxID=1594786 RepID=A0A8J4U9U6_CLAMG|nr:Protein sprouty 2 [Clarias magur]
MSWEIVLIAHAHDGGSPHTTPDPRHAMSKQINLEHHETSLNTRYNSLISHKRFTH